jgi:hypothetical protein
MTTPMTGAPKPRVAVKLGYMLKMGPEIGFKLLHG